jgi:cell division protein ZapE
MGEAWGVAVHLTERFPEVGVDALLSALVPPPQFADVSFDSYRPAPDQPSQAAAVERLRRFAAEVDAPAQGRGLLRRRRGAPATAGIYLDGGFGVGKTHLLASLFHATSGTRSYATFVELTSLVGALGFAATVDALSDRSLLCIDEFELDDPGDTVLVSTLLQRLREAGVRFAATSNTQPEDLGEGRFAAADFLREIQGLASHFVPLRIDGDDYRARGLAHAPEPEGEAACDSVVAATPDASDDRFDDLLAHLADVHPSRYGALVDGISVAVLRDVRPVTDQNVALRLVALTDRLYDRGVALVSSGTAFDRVFPPEMLAGGYRKKYSRAVSRLAALAAQGAEQVAALAA